jgi:hypothetical protein
MAPGDGAFGTTRMGVEERVNSWLAGLCKNSIPPPDSIEFINAYGKVDKMYQLPKKTKSPPRVFKKSSPTPPSPPKPSSGLPLLNFLLERQRRILKEKIAN